MANLVANQLRTNVLEAYFKSTPLFLRLYKDSASIVEGTTLTSLASHEQDGSGYSVKSLSVNDWTIESGVGGIRARLEDQVWTTTADDWGTIGWSVLCTSADDSGDILLASDHGTGKTVTGTGANVTIDDLIFQLDS